MSKYYPYSYFCDRYGCWCDDVPEITDDENDCNGNCLECEDCSEPNKK